MKVDQDQAVWSVSVALDVLGDKWTLLILRDMLFEGKSSFTEFKASREKIASNILTARLKMLDLKGFVIKTATADNKVKYRYSLTDKAIDLLPMLLELFCWAATHSEGQPYTSPVYKKLESKNSVDIAAYSMELKKHRDSELGI
jgi:DNA-binding HxlR family transcriptional regulator